MACGGGDKAAWQGPEFARSQRAVDSHIKNLRGKCAAIDPDHEWIRSVYGVGFVLEEHR